LNLVHYRAFRGFDIRGLQESLSHLGLSRLGKAEAHLLASLQMTKNILEGFIDPGRIHVKQTFLGIAQGNALLTRHTDALLGARPQKRPVRIMVTQPTETAMHSELVTEMVQSGMDIARINCAHDTPETWKAIMGNTQRANQELGKEGKVCMDLGGPKIRVGTIYKGSNMVKYKPAGDENGIPREGGELFLISQTSENSNSGKNTLVLPGEWINCLQPGSTLKFMDGRGKLRKLKIRSLFEGGAIAYGKKTAYLKKGLELTTKHREGKKSALIKEVHFTTNRFLSLRPGDILRMENDAATEGGNFPQTDVSKPRISCTSAAIYTFVRIGERVLFDDGKIGGKIIALYSHSMEIQITHAKATGGILKEDKGINFPDTDLKINGLTKIDKGNLPFVAAHADIVNLSFVNRGEDVEELLKELDRIPQGRDLGIILKIETKSGIANLTEILLTGMRSYPMGLMIARGDLAVECGWENMAMIQEEMLSLCMAAHIPVIWATQVLENLAKKGIPSRPEITDAAMSQRAECVMLNKGPHIVEAIRLLDHILTTMSQYQYKKSPILPIMETFRP
ncbi:MAG: pyruvate kinase, partial [Bacteroidota bacterium]